MIRVLLPYHLRNLAGISGEVTVSVSAPATQRTLIDAIEAQYPVLKGTIREYATQRRRAYIRFFACEQDLSNTPLDAPLPQPVAAGEEPFLIVGAIAGG